MTLAQFAEQFREDGFAWALITGSLMLLAFTLGRLFETRRLNKK